MAQVYEEDDDAAYAAALDDFEANLPGAEGGAANKRKLADTAPADGLSHDQAAAASPAKKLPYMQAKPHATSAMAPPPQHWQQQQQGGGAADGAAGPPAWDPAAHQVVSDSMSVAPPVDPAVPMCACGEPCAMRTSQSARNPGRSFWRCSKPQGGGQCDFFLWADAAPHSAAKGAAPNANNASGPAASAAGNTCFKCGTEGHWARNCPNAGPGGGYNPTGSGYNATRGGYNAAGEGYTAAYGTTAAPTAASQSGPAPVGGTAFAPYGGYGARAAAAAALNTGPEGSAYGFNYGAANGHNAEGGAAAGTSRFAWEDDARRAGPAAGAPGAYGGGDGATGNCYKCGQEGHWAKDCPTAAGGGGGGSGFRAGGGATGTCYKCGQEGHWARDCPGAGGAGGGYGGGGYGGFGGGGAGGGGRPCYKCGQEGHWARDCPTAAAGGGGSYGGGYGGGAGGGGRGYGSAYGSGGRSGAAGGAGRGAAPAGGKCYRCNEVGHFSRECPNR